MFLMGAVVPGANCLWVSYKSDKLCEKSFSSGSVIFQTIARSIYLETDVWKAIFFRGNCPGCNNLGGNHPEDNCFEGNYQGRDFLRGK